MTVLSAGGGIEGEIQELWCASLFVCLFMRNLKVMCMCVRQDRF